MERTKKDVVVGILTAIAFGLVGCVAWGVLYYLNVIAGIAAFLVLFLAGYAYKKFGKVKYFSKLDYAILIVISVVELVITMLVTFGIIIQVTYAEYEISIGFFEAIKEMFSLASYDDELKIALISDIVVSLIFLTAAIVYYIVGERRKKQAEQQFVQNVSNASKSNAEQAEVKVEEQTDKQEENKE